MREIDLRSDTVTLPTPAMREAIYRAELGDDVFGEDPTVNRREAMAAERVGKEAAVFVVSGTMGNLTALLTHCQRGHEAIMGDKAHTFLFEVGGSAVLGGIHPHTLPNQPDGTLRLEDVEAAIRPENPHHPRTRLICLENTHNRCGGVVLTPGYTDAVGELAHRRGLAVHLDGARVFNAAVALGLDVRELTRAADSVQFCLSKGLSAPVGSLLCGTKAFIDEARRWRKTLGGGMRQAGVLAAAGIEGLENMVGRLAHDHVNARRLAEGLAQMPGFAVNLGSVQTNIVIWDLATDRATPREVTERLRAKGVKILPIGGRQFRAVTHYGIEASDIDQALAVTRQVMEQLV
ncbi:MAG: low-specificity L-threonine aldolase [Anaerolineae bacterium]|nr:MAG: low-specificity L-threonine aldolase [Anaerolineae bacterium]